LREESGACEAVYLCMSHRKMMRQQEGEEGLGGDEGGGAATSDNEEHINRVVFQEIRHSILRLAAHHLVSPHRVGTHILACASHMHARDILACDVRSDVRCGLTEACEKGKRAWKSVERDTHKER